MRDLVILGASGNAREIIDLVRAINAGGSHWRVAAILDDDRHRWGQVLDGVRVAGPLEAADAFGDAAFVLAVGSPTTYRLRPSLIGCLPADTAFATLVHPSAAVASNAAVGPGSVLFANTTVGVDAVVGAHVLVLANTVVSHDVVVGDCAGIASGVTITGGGRLGATCYIGAASSIAPGVSIGEEALVGMGSVVLRDVPPGVTVVGNPARILDQMALPPSAA